ncbi:MAG: DNA polymerase III subunit gamma/tau [Leptolyngbyaceae cyanobacterium CSU_1_3]|nr:DNA polymerase III subunit gamma/tau [Leptolyngbyaceae cyanobacterium CSU_1_3]
MPYQPLHHKYRPQTFAQLVGQEAIATTLSNALNQQRIAPAYLFIGARGTGKTSSARIFAKSLNCMAAKAPTDTPCGVCETCRSITNGSALDVIEIDAASNTGVDNIRELIERAQFAPVQCRYKVYAIDEVHMLSNAAFNALLKTLEEPPDRVVFVLATTDPQRVLPTIISRCQRFDFRRISLESMVPHLKMIAQKESIEITDDALQLIGQLSQGGLRDAESLLDQLSLLAGEVTVDRVWDLVGAVPERDLMALLEAISTRDPEAVLDHSRHLMDRGREPLTVLQNLASFYRDLAIAKTSPHRHDLVAITPPTWKQLCKFAQSQNLETILAGQQHLRSSEMQLKQTTQPRLWLEVALLGLLPFEISAPPRPIVSYQPAGQAIPSTVAERRVPAAPIAPEVPVPEASPEPSREVLETIADSSPSSPSDDPSTQLAQTWQQILENIDLPSTQGILSANCYLLTIDTNEIVVGVQREQMLKMTQRMLPQIGKAAAKTLQLNKIKVSLQVAEATLSPTITPAAPQFSDDDTTAEPPTPALPLSDNLPPATPEAPRLETPWKEEDDGTKAAKSLAYAFNGAVVDLDNDNNTDQGLMGKEIMIAAIEPDIPELEEESDEDDDDDVDF